MAIDDIGSPRYALALELDDEDGKSVLTSGTSRWPGEEEVC